MVFEFGVMGLSPRRHSQRFQALLEKFVPVAVLQCVFEACHGSLL